MKNIKLESLLKELGLNYEGVKIEENENIIIVDGMEYMVLTEEERDQEFKEYQENLIEDLGINCFSEWAREYIINNFVNIEWFKEAQKESFEFYIEDIKEEFASSEEFENRLEEEMLEANIEDEEEFLNYLCEEDAMEWFKFNFGKEELSRVVIEKDLIDYGKVIEWIAYIDGYDCLASWDGIEIELDNNLYAYRMN